jgi:L,D-peptidoglycan transpeptidase YkuD (ErfK/YbiS/YcfS/YnhG family)
VACPGGLSDRNGLRKGKIAIFAHNIVVRSLSAGRTTGRLTCGNLVVPCALGLGGIATRKREGDGATPRGRFRFETVLFRSGRLIRPSTGLASRTLRADDGWCDAAEDRNYNRPVTHPYPARAERLWRADGLYDVIVVVDYNRRPRRRGKGSAIFLHVAKPGYAPTQGCVALARRDLIKVLARIGPRTRLIVV